MNFTDPSALDDNSRTLLALAAQFAPAGFPGDFLRIAAEALGVRDALYRAALRTLMDANLLQAAGSHELALRANVSAGLRESMTEEQWTHVRVAAASQLVQAAEVVASEFRRIEALESNLVVAAELAPQVLPENPKVLWPAICLGRMAEARGQLPEAERWYRSALTCAETLFRGNALAVVPQLNNLALVLHHQGRSPEAVPMMEQALELKEGQFGPHHPELLNTLNTLATVLQSSGDSDRAAEAYGRALVILDAREARAPLEPQYGEMRARLQTNLGMLYLEAERTVEAEELFGAALTWATGHLGADHELIGLIKTNLGGLRQITGSTDEARELFREALRILSERLPPNHPWLRRARENVRRFG